MLEIAAFKLRNLRKNFKHKIRKISLISNYNLIILGCTFKISQVVLINRSSFKKGILKKYIFTKNNCR